MHPSQKMLWCCLLIFGALVVAPLSKAQAEDGKAERETAEPSRPVVVGYLPAYRMTKLFDAERLAPVTDLIYFGLQLSKDGAIGMSQADQANAKQLQKIKKQTGCRLLVCVGGWGRSEHFNAVTADPDKRRALIDSLVALCMRHGFDGVDYDWEHPKGVDELAAYADLIEATAKAFEPDGLLVTVAQAGWQDLGKRAYQALHRVHLMCYDQAFPQATMAHAKEEVDRLIKWGCPKEKIVLGIPFYGRNEQRKALSYAELVKDNDAWAPAKDRYQGYALNGPDTVQAKTQYAVSQGLAGVMIWELGQDLPGPRSLLSAVGRGLERAKRGEGP